MAREEVHEQVREDVVGSGDVSRIEAPVTMKAYMMCAFAAFGGIFFGFDSGYINGVLAMPFFIKTFTGKVSVFSYQIPLLHMIDSAVLGKTDNDEKAADTLEKMSTFSVANSSFIRTRTRAISRFQRQTPLSLFRSCLAAHSSVPSFPVILPIGLAVVQPSSPDALSSL